MAVASNENRMLEDTMSVRTGGHGTSFFLKYHEKNKYLFQTITVQCTQRLPSNDINIAVQLSNLVNTIT